MLLQPVIPRNFYSLYIHLEDVIVFLIKYAFTTIWVNVSPLVLMK